jgi:putative transposase
MFSALKLSLRPTTFLQTEGYDFKWLVERVASQLGLGPQEVLALGKYRQNVKARSLLCYWAARELGMTTIELSKKLKLSQPTISQSVKRGQKLAQKLGLCLLEKGK